MNLHRKLSIFVLVKVRIPQKIFIFLLFWTTIHGIRSQFPAIDVATPSLCALGKATVNLINCTNCTNIQWRLDNGPWVGGTSTYSTILSNPGTIDVEVKFDVGGNTGYLKAAKAITIRKLPVPKIWLSHPRLCNSNDTVTLVDTTSPVAVSRLWFIENKTYSNASKKLKTLFSTNPGVKSLFLEIVDSFGCKGKTTLDTFGVWLPTKAVILPYNQIGCVPRKVFYQLVVDSAGQSYKSVTWNFQNGNPATQSKLFPDSVLYTKKDTHDVSVTFLTNKGCTYTFTRNNIIDLGSKSTLNISASKTKVCYKEKFTLSASGYQNSGFLKWTVVGTLRSADSLVGSKIGVRLLDTGAINIFLEENNKGCMSYANKNRFVSTNGPVARFNTLMANYCITPDTIQFKNTSMMPSTGTNTYSWFLFENGKTPFTSSSTSTDFQYKTNIIADWDIMLIAKNSGGCIDTNYSTLAVQGGKIKKAFSFGPNPACPGQNVSFMPAAGFGGTIWPNYYKWSFYRPNSSLYSSSIGINPAVNFPTDGDYSVKMVVKNNKGCTDSLYLKDSIHIRTPQIQIVVSDTLPCKNQQITLYPVVTNKRSVSKGKWQFTHLDSTGLDFALQTDTVVIKLAHLGRYKVSFSLTDTTPGGCSIISTYPNKIKVSGTNFKISTAITQGCNPFVFNPSMKIINSANFTKPAGTKTYAWYTYPLSNVSYAANNGVAVPTITCQKGMHNIYVKYDNGSGCSDSAGPIQIESGVSAGFFPQALKCAKRPIKLNNQSNFIATAFEWSCDSAGVVFQPNSFAKEPNVVFPKAGDYTVRLIAKAAAGCRDTIKKSITVEYVKADFVAPDSISFCAPKLVVFISKSNGVADFWKFGDGDSTISYYNQSVSHLYPKNHPRPGYNITMISSSMSGCLDTMFKKGYIKIIGPIADFDVAQNRGCEKLQVKFLNNSTDYSRFYLDFGDGSVLDSSKFNSHDYIVTDRSKPTQVFYPKLALYDSNGCFVLAFPKDSVVVLKNAEARNKFDSRYFIRKNVGCSPLFVNSFTDLSSYAQSIQWDFDNDGKIDQNTKTPPGWLYSKSGVYRPMNIAISANGCRDTFYGDSLWVMQSPNPDFKMQSDTVCPRKPVKFFNTSTGKYKLVSQFWKFGDGLSYTDTSELKYPIYTYKIPFDHVVTLDIMDSTGCPGKVQKPIYVADTAGPPASFANFITVLPDGNTVLFNFHEHPNKNFTNYHLFEDYISKTEKAVKSNIKDTTYSFFVGSILRYNKVCYTYKTEDTCNIVGRLSYAPSHCTISLRDSIKEPYHVELHWSYYVGWLNQIQSYRIYRKDNPTDTFKRIAVVDQTAQSYTDSFLCDKTYAYYVEAVHKNKIFTSRSNIVNSKPIYLKPDKSVPVTLVSVINNKDIFVKWDPYYKKLTGAKYIVERSENGLNGPFTFMRRLSGLSLLDQNTDLPRKTYAYRVRFEDHCGSPSAAGIEQRMLRLKDTVGFNGLQLYWQPYLNWPLGVNHYILQYKKPNGWKTISKYSSFVNDTNNLEFTELGNDTICFRVLAVREGNFSDTAISNWVCKVPESKIYLPTAFSPHERGANPIYKAYPSFILNTPEDPLGRFEMHIFDRWGQKVFECMDYNQGWDGTFMGKMCSNGYYMVTVKALGFDGVPHRLHQMIYLLR